MTRAQARQAKPSAKPAAQFHTERLAVHMIAAEEAATRGMEGSETISHLENWLGILLIPIMSIGLVLGAAIVLGAR